MPRPDVRDAGLLRALERRRELALDEAREVHAERTAALERDESAQARLETALESAYDAGRELVRAGGVVSGELLRVAHDYGRVQTAAIGKAREASGGSRRLVATAREEVADRLEEYKAIERLREKRGRDDVQWDRRRAQWRLDELGLIRGSKRESTWPSRE
jgi:hypothetical protein